MGNVCFDFGMGHEPLPYRGDTDGRIAGSEKTLPMGDEAVLSDGGEGASFLYSKLAVFRNS